LKNSPPIILPTVLTTLYLFRILILLTCFQSAFAQELFPMYEPASTMPEGVIGVRAGTHVHYKYNQAGHREFLKMMYGVSSRLTVIGTITASNFHLDKFPSDLNSHYKENHNHKSKAVNYPYTFEGVHLFTKWRFFTRDHQNEHLRLALYSEVAFNNTVHLDAFPVLTGDQSGAGIGLIGTKLHNKFAASLASGITGFISHTTHAGADTVKFRAGRAFTTSLSLGYLIFPRQYKSYRDLNINIYLEFQARFFDRPIVSRNNTVINGDQFEYLRKGNLINAYPGIQFIFDSRTRLDLSMETLILSSSNLNRYSMLILSVQRYVY
jgi:hypothetical protein